MLLKLITISAFYALVLFLRYKIYPVYEIIRVREHKVPFYCGGAE